MEFSRQEQWSGLLFLSPGYFPNSGIKPTFPKSSALAGRFFTIVPSGKSLYNHNVCQKWPKIQHSFDCGFLTCALYFPNIFQKWLWGRHTKSHCMGVSLNREGSRILLVWICCWHQFYKWGLLLFEVNALCQNLLKTPRQNEQKQRVEKKGCDSHHFTSDWVRAHLDYFIHFWKPHLQTDIVKWEHIQRRERRMVKETILWQVKCCSMNQGCDLGGLRKLITCIEKVVRWKKWFDIVVWWKKCELWNQVDQVQILTLPLIGCMTFTKFLNSSEPCFSCWLKIEEHNTSRDKLPWGLKKIIYMKALSIVLGSKIYLFPRRQIKFIPQGLKSCSKG